MANSVTVSAFASGLTNSIGGLSKIWIRAWDSAAIVDETSAGFVEIVPVNMSLKLTQVQQTGTGKAVDQTVVFTLIDNTTDGLEGLMDQLLQDYFLQVIVKLKSGGKKIVVGESYGLRATVTYDSGAKMGDLRGATIELKGVNDKFGREL